MAIGDIIRKYRKNKGMTQEEMAACLGVTTPAVNKWENHFACTHCTAACYYHRRTIIL